jgi:hypothetical protein
MLICSDHVAPSCTGLTPSECCLRSFETSRVLKFRGMVVRAADGLCGGRAG